MNHFFFFVFKLYHLIPLTSKLKKNLNIREHAAGVTRVGCGYERELGKRSVIKILNVLNAMCFKSKKPCTPLC